MKMKRNVIKNNMRANDDNNKWLHTLIDTALGRRATRVIRCDVRACVCVCSWCEREKIWNYFYCRKSRMKRLKKYVTEARRDTVITWLSNWPMRANRCFLCIEPSEMLIDSRCDSSRRQLITPFRIGILAQRETFFAAQVPLVGSSRSRREAMGDEVEHGFRLICHILLNSQRILYIYWVLSDSKNTSRLH